MKSLTTQFITGVLAALTAGLLGCGNSPPPASIPNPESAIESTADGVPVTSSDVRQQVGEAVDAASKYAGQTKDEYQAAMQKRLDEMDARIEELQTKADVAGSEAKGDTERQYETSMSALREKRQATADRFAELKEASAEAWQDIAAGVDSAWDNFSAAFKSAASRFEDSEAEAENSPPDTPTSIE